MSAFERYLSIWVALAIIAGLALGQIAPGLVSFLASLEYGSVNFVVAILIWFMVYPMMVAVDFRSLARVHERPKGMIITLAVNWLIKPFTMAALGVLFFDLVFAPFIEPGTSGQYIAGLILLGAAPCTAMVFVWSQLTKGDPNYTLAQVSLNDAIMVFAYAPIVALLLGVTDITVPWETLVLSVGLYVVIPLAGGHRHARDDDPRGGQLGRGRGGGRGLHGKGEALFHRGPAGDGRFAVRLSGRGDPQPAAGDRDDRDPAADPVLWHFRDRLLGGKGLARAAQRGGPLRDDRHVEFL